MSTKVIPQNSVRVICLGEVLYDNLAGQLGTKLTESSVSWTSYPGGAPANVACALVKLGISTAFVGCVGHDSPGQSLVQFLQSTGVNVSGIQYTNSAPTRQVYVTRTLTGDRQFAGFGGRSPEQFADAYLNAQNLSPKLFLEAEYLVLGTLELAYPASRQAIFRALELAEEFHLKVLLDINWRPSFWPNPEEAISWIKKLWHRIDFLKMTKEEALWLFGTGDAGAIFYNLDSLEGVFISDGANNVSYCIAEQEGKITPPQVKAKDTTGAGDAFVAGLIHQLCNYGVSQLSNPQLAHNIVQYACAMGSITATKEGAITAQPNEIEIANILSKI